MKSIIIIIALFLVTLTAKADWVKSGELDSLYLGDAPITFSKYSPDYTKFVTYSAQDSTLRLWDLETGQVIKERTFDWSYKYDVCEFDFENEMFYLVKNTGELYPGSYKKNTFLSPDNVLWYISFNNKLNYLVTCRDNVSSLGGPDPILFIDNYVCKQIVVNKSICLTYTLEKIRNNTANNQVYTEYYTQNINIDSSLFVTRQISFKDLDLNVFIKYNTNCFIAQYYNNYKYHKAISIQYYDSLISYPNFDRINNMENYPLSSTGINPLDINYNSLVYFNAQGIVKIFSRKEVMNIDLGIPHNSNSIMSIKLINSIRYSIYYLKNKYFVLSDNQEKKILDTISLPFGNVGYSERDSMVYSEKSNTIYRRGLVFEKNEVDYIYINKTSYLNTDTIVLKKNYNQSDSNLIWTIDGKIYTEVSPKVVISSPGYYNVKLEFLRNSKQYLIERDSFIIVYDPTDIQDFAERKYIFKQDAEGIYCQLEGEGEVSLYDNVGRLVRTYQIENEQYIRKEDLERGVYFLSIQTGGKVYYEKVLVE